MGYRGTTVGGEMYPSAAQIVPGKPDAWNQTVNGATVQRFIGLRIAPALRIRSTGQRQIVTQQICHLSGYLFDNSCRGCFPIADSIAILRVL